MGKSRGGVPLAQVPLDLAAAVRGGGGGGGGGGGDAAAHAADGDSDDDAAPPLLAGFTAASGRGGDGRESLVEVLDWRLALADIDARARAARWGDDTDGA